MEIAKILMVEDETIIALNTKSVLEARGHEIMDIVPTGEEAIKFVEEHTPSLILMDIILDGDIDGITAVTEIKKKHNIPIIYLTSHSDEITLNRAKATEPYGFIIKPLNKDELYSAIELALYKHKMETRLLEREERLQMLSEASFEAIALHDAGIIVEANQQYYDMFGYTKEELHGKNAIPLTVAPESVKFLLEHVESGSLESYELTGLKKDGIEFPVEIRLRETVHNGKKMRIGVIRDITERKRAEKTINVSLNEKKTLLKEIHHRVKNNFQVIVSLLSLQERSIKNKQIIKLLREPQNRIRAMALIHEKLYQSDDLASIDFSEYINILAVELFQTYLCDPERVKLKVQADNILLDINQAIPCGLIINELISNSIKHAFPPEIKRKGEINVQFNKKEKTMVELKINDNGVGLPDDFDPEKLDSLGLKLLPSLVMQLDGEYELNREKGTGFVIRFHNQ